jgi:hypothetical protein
MDKNVSLIVLLLTALAVPGAALTAQETDSRLGTTDYEALAFRNIGPAINGGRIADIDIHPENRSVWYVAVGSGGVWKTENAGTTWRPIFDDQPSYSIGSLAIDPSEPSTVWVGTGEDVGGRHVGYGDGVYKSTDGGQTWQNKGLGNTEHISTMVVHPENSDVVWVSAQGPLWTPGGERGLYKTADGGETWRKLLGDDEWTGVTDIVMDPRDPDVLYAATWQRHRTVAAYMGGGPGSGIHKSTDGGETWNGPGPSSRPASRPPIWGRSGSRSRHKILTLFTRPSSSTAVRAACTVPRTAARRGRRCPTPSPAPPDRTTTRSFLPRRTSSGESTW